MTAPAEVTWGELLDAVDRHAAAEYELAELGSAHASPYSDRVVYAEEVAAAASRYLAALGARLGVSVEDAQALVEVLRRTPAPRGGAA